MSTGTAVASEGGESDPPQIANLRVLSGEGPWQAEEVFRLGWEQVPADPAAPVVAVEYQLYDEAGQPLGAVVRNTSNLRSIERLRVSTPGAYTVEVWLRDSNGRTGPHATAALRYDNAAPAAPLPQAPSGWIAGNERALLTIGHPAGEQPLSGIRGYAFSIDDGSGSSPCVTLGRCTIAETDLPGGAGDDTVWVGPLPEGATVARVVAVSGAGVASAVTSTTIHVDATRPDVRLGGVPSGWANGPVRVQARAGDSLSGMEATGPAGAFTGISVDGAAPVIAWGDTASAVVTGSGVHNVAFFARDAAGNVADGSAGAPTPENATVRIDEVPPAVRFAERQDPNEPERIEATVEDGLSGPSGSRGSISVRQVGGKGAFQDLPTEIVDGRLVAHWDSDSFPTGRYEFHATGYDAAGNAATGTNRVRGGRMVLVNPLKTPVVVASELSAARTIPYGGGVRFGGRVRTLFGKPLPGLDVTITETFAEGSRAKRRVSYARTGQDGTFSAWLGPGPSREVVASFSGSRLLTRAAGSVAHLDVRGSVRLRTSSPVARVGGRPIVFSGRVGHRGITLPREGRAVELQFRYPGATWSGFRTVQADATGRFRYRYAFSDDDSRGVRFQFRAYVPAEEGWPYGPAYSAPVSVKGR